MNLSDLTQVKTIITHKDCPDGVASAVLLHDALPNAAIRFVQHGTPEMETLKAEPGMLFCDITPPKERVQEFIAAGALVLDHHKGAEAIVRAFGDRGVFADEKTEPGVSGALLAYQEVWLPLADPDETTIAEEFAKLAGVRDTWQTQSTDWREACALSAALTFYSPESWLDVKDPFNPGSSWLLDRTMVGTLLLEKKARDVAKAIERAFYFYAGANGGGFDARPGWRVLVFEGTTLSSDVAETVGSRYDLVVGFGFTAEGGKQKLILSTRSHAAFDCAAFCKAHGGNGHTKAAGCSIELVMGGYQPYTTIERLVRGWRDRP